MSPEFDDVTRRLRVRCALVAVLAVLMVLSSFPAAAGAQASDQEVQTITQETSVVLTLSPDAQGWPVGVEADVVASADLEMFVVDVYVDDVLISSNQQPTTLDVEFEPTSETRSVRITAREFGEVINCEVNSGFVQLQNIDVSRVPGGDTSIALVNEPSWTIDASSTAEVANVAAIGTLATTVDGFRLREAGDVTVSVGAGQEYESSTELWEELSAGPDLLPGTGERLVVTQRSELSKFGGEVFISESEFGGRVGSVRLAGEILVAPQLDIESGYAVRINDQIVDTGTIDANGQGMIDVVVEEALWPRDATIAVDLTFAEADSPCTDERPFSGQVEFTATPIGIPTSELSLSDFPAVLLEEGATLWAGEGASAHDVAVVSSALQAVSAKRISFGDAERDDASVVVVRNGESSVVVDDGQLIFSLTDDLVELLQEERFWVFTDESVVEGTVVDVIPESLAFADEVPLANASGMFSLFRVVPFALLVLLVVAVLSLLWKNSKAPAES